MPDVEEDRSTQQPIAILTSLGLYGIRSDIEELTGRQVSLSPFKWANADSFIGWGHRPSGIRAKTLSHHAKRPTILMEDGFLKGFRKDVLDPPHSYVIDYTGIYFDTAHPNDLSDLIDSTSPSENEIDKAKSLIKLIRDEKLTKFSSSNVKKRHPSGLKNYVLVVDQVPNDKSISGAGADQSTFAFMLEHAASRSEAEQIVIRTHPSSNSSFLIKKAKELGISVTKDCSENPWLSLENADAIYTVSSHLGFEALMAEKPVYCFGDSFYSGRGLTIDEFTSRRFKRPSSLQAMFLAAYRDYAKYLDLHSRERCTLEHALQQMIEVRDQRARLKRRAITIGFSPWKRRAMAPFLIGSRGLAIHKSKMRLKLTRHGQSTSNDVAIIWGNQEKPRQMADSFRLEDGFIRSRGLGVKLVYPCSLCIDGQRPHYDARGPSDLEDLLSNFQFDPTVLMRANRLRTKISKSKITKYNLEEGAMPSLETGHRLRILVPGQIEKDASLKYGSPALKTNWALVYAVRELYPDAFIVFKPHPDSKVSLRSGGLWPEHQNLIAESGTIDDWMCWADRVETLTSLTGFEALLRNKKVGVHGHPFYAGWGLTDDRLPLLRRSRKLSIDELVAGALLLYPLYLHPLSRLPCSVEALVDALIDDPK